MRPAPSLLLSYTCLYIPDLFAVSLHPLLSLIRAYIIMFRFIIILDITAVDYFHIGLEKEYSLYFKMVRREYSDKFPRTKSRQ